MAPRAKLRPATTTVASLTGLPAVGVGGRARRRKWRRTTSSTSRADRPPAIACMRSSKASTSPIRAAGQAIIDAGAGQPYPQSLPGCRRRIRPPPGAHAAPTARRRAGDPLPATASSSSSVARRQRLVELGFNLPAAGLTAPATQRLADSARLPLPRLGFAPLDGYLKGFIDLVFCHANRFYVLDWKSNHLGLPPPTMASSDMAAAMACTRLPPAIPDLLRRAAPLPAPADRRLRLRAHFGGVHYLFVRGVRPGWHEVTPAVSDSPAASTTIAHTKGPSTLSTLCCRVLRW
jgi:hypothetical protein